MSKTDKNANTPSQRNWYKDRYESVITQRNFLGIITLASLILALIAGLIILYMIPQKSVMPFLIQVDDKTGFTQIIEQSSLKKISADESLRRYFVIKFLLAREGYDQANLGEMSNEVRLLSERSIYRKYINEVVNPQNKESLYVVLGELGFRQVEIKSVQFLDATRAQVRLSITTGSKNINRSPSTAHYIALVTFDFLPDLKLKVEDMAVNPLGFQVIEYRLDKDAFM